MTDVQFDQILEQIDRQQQSGHIGEIGVYHGKSFVHILKLCRPAELALAVGCFDMQEHNRRYSGNAKEDVFLRNLADPKRVRILECNSLDITAADYIGAVRGKFCIFHVDAAMMPKRPCTT